MVDGWSEVAKSGLRQPQPLLLTLAISIATYRSIAETPGRRRRGIYKDAGESRGRPELGRRTDAPSLPTRYRAKQKKETRPIGRIIVDAARRAHLVVNDIAARCQERAHAPRYRSVRVVSYVRGWRARRSPPDEIAGRHMRCRFGPMAPQMGPYASALDSAPGNWAVGAR